MIRVIIEGLVKRYGQVAAVDDASLEIAPGELACVLGPPGAGKTTLGRLVAGLEAPDDGEIYLDDRMVLALAPQERRVGMVFPDYALWPGMTVADNVAYPLKIQGLKAPERRQRVGEALTALRIDSLAGRRPDQLSPPQALRVAIARAIVTRPDLLILDEPLEPFEPRSRDEAWDEIRKLRSELEITTLLLTRVVSEAIAHADRLAVMDLGRIVQVGAPQDLYNNPADVFVARLLGPTNLLQGQVDSNGNDGRKDVVVRTPVGRLVARSSGPGPAPGKSRHHLDPPRNPLARAFDSARLEPVSRHDRAHHLPWRHPPDRPPRTRRLADHRAHPAMPASGPARGTEPDLVGLSRLRPAAAGEVRGGEWGVITSELKSFTQRREEDAKTQRRENKSFRTKSS